MPSHKSLRIKRVLGKKAKQVCIRLCHKPLTEAAGARRALLRRTGGACSSALQRPRRGAAALLHKGH